MTTTFNSRAKQPVANQGLGAASADGVCPDDDEFDAYRKRMMLAYRFRPNPLVNTNQKHELLTAILNYLEKTCKKFERRFERWI